MDNDDRKLWEFFAGQALAGLCTDIIPERRCNDRENFTELDLAVERAWNIATAMMTHRKKLLDKTKLELTFVPQPIPTEEDPGDIDDDLIYFGPYI